MLEKGAFDFVVPLKLILFKIEQNSNKKQPISGIVFFVFPKQLKGSRKLCHAHIHITANQYQIGECVKKNGLKKNK